MILITRNFSIIVMIEFPCAWSRILSLFGGSCIRKPDNFAPKLTNLSKLFKFDCF